MIFDCIAPQGYKGGKTTIKNYVAAHADLVPAKRKLAAAEPQGSRGKRFKTEPGEAYQMDWGFVDVKDWAGGTFRIACFAMVCHHCGTCYVEFFPNARQENLFIGMIHAFMVMGVPEHVLTDNLKWAVAHFMFNGGLRVMRSSGMRLAAMRIRTPHYILVSVGLRRIGGAHDRHSKGLQQGKDHHRGFAFGVPEGLHARTAKERAFDWPPFRGAVAEIIENNPGCYMCSVYDALVERRVDTGEFEELPGNEWTLSVCAICGIA